MRKLTFLGVSLFTILAFISACDFKPDHLSIESPNEILKLSFELKEGVAFYSVDRNSKAVIKPSKLGFELKDLPALNGNFIVKNHKINITISIIIFREFLIVITKRHDCFRTLLNLIKKK